MELFLCRLKHTSDYNYSMAETQEVADREHKGRYFLYPADKFTIFGLAIEASIFAPMRITVVLDTRNFTRKFHNPEFSNRFIPYHTILGIGMFDDFQLEGSKIGKTKSQFERVGIIDGFLSRKVESKDKYYKKYDPTDRRQYDKSDQLEFKGCSLYAEENRGSFDTLELPYCLLSNRPNQFVPFVVIKIENSIPDNSVTLTLLEKRVCALSLCHKFECFAKNNGVSNSNEAKGLLSVPEIIEHLSVVPEDEDAKIDDASVKKIVNFSSAGINRDKDKGPTDPKEQTEHCAFLSRFIAPSSQSRLSIIYSLARKYGYGLVYRPRSKQYYAIDLLSSTAPGRITGKPTLYVAPDCYTFDDEDDEYYYGEYSSEYPNDIHNLDESYKYKYYLLEKNTDPNLNNFFIYRLFTNSVYHTFPITITTQPGCCTYQYLSRYNHTFSNAGEYNLDLTSILPIDKKDLDEQNWQTGDAQTKRSILRQNKLLKYKEGCNYTSYEDQVNLELTNLTNEEKSFASRNQILTANQRLAYARYKLGFMKNNKRKYGMEFYSQNTRPNHISNFIYETLNRLGYHISLFSYAAMFTYPYVKKKNTGASSATHSIAEGIPPQGLDVNLSNFFNNLYQDNPYDITESIFANVKITVNNLGFNNGSERFIEAKTEYCETDDVEYNENDHRGTTKQDRIVGAKYSIGISMHFYNDPLDYNLTPSLKPFQDKSESNLGMFGNTQIINGLCSYILHHLYLNKNPDTQRRDRELIKTKSDSLLIVKTYIAYKRLFDQACNISDMKYNIEQQKRIEDILNNPQKKSYYMQRNFKNEEELWYHEEYGWALKNKKSVQDNLERLSKMPVIQNGRFIKLDKDSFKDLFCNLYNISDDELKKNNVKIKERWYTLNPAECKGLGRNYYPVLEEPCSISNSDAINEFRALHNSVYTNGTDGGAR